MKREDIFSIIKNHKDGKISSNEAVTEIFLLVGEVPPTRYDCDMCEYFPCQKDPDTYGGENKKVLEGNCYDFKNYLLVG